MDPMAVSMSFVTHVQMETSGLTVDPKKCLQQLTSLNQNKFKRKLEKTCFFVKGHFWILLGHVGYHFGEEFLTK